MRLCPPKFINEQAQTYSAATGYAVTNEEPGLFNDLLRNTRVDRAACIASGGEVLFSVLLHRANSILAVDHSERSITTCYAKLLLSQKLSTKTIRQLLQDEKYEELKKELNGIMSHLPAMKRPVTDPISYEWSNVRREWCDKRFRLPVVTKRNMDKLTFVCRDFRNLQQTYGLFDMFYASNVMEHTGQNGRAPTISDLCEVLKPGGLLLFTSSVSGRYFDDGSPLEKLEQIKGFRTSWYHYLARKK